MTKIKKNLSDADMLVNWQEETTFETTVLKEEPVQKRAAALKDKQSLNSSFLTAELQEKVGKALLELKVELYKDGIVDYDIKVSCRDKQVILVPVPAKKKKV
ncbi:MAG: hypothetical protein LLG02_10500 [Pelosinus sp.]|nr:hypothetical protein [Pelosinus sp.]